VVCCVWMCQEQRKESEARTKTEKRQLWFWWVWEEEAIAKVRSKNRNQSKAKSKAEWMELVGGLMMGERRYAQVAPTVLVQSHTDEPFLERKHCTATVSASHSQAHQKTRNSRNPLRCNGFGVCTIWRDWVLLTQCKSVRKNSLDWIGSNQRNPTNGLTLGNERGRNSYKKPSR